MSPRTRLTSLLVLALCALAALPALAAADGRRGGDREARGFGGGDVSSRVASRLRRADRALDRAEERVDDGETAKAIAQLKANRRALSLALTSALKRDDDSLEAVMHAQHKTIATVTGLFDGVTDGDLVSALDATLDAAIAGRDKAVAASEDDGGVDGDVADEREAIAEALADDELTDAAKTSLGDADTALQATATAAEASGASETEDAGAPGGPGGRGGRGGDCPKPGDGDAPAQSPGSEPS